MERHLINLDILHMLSMTRKHALVVVVVISIVAADASALCHRLVVLPLGYHVVYPNGN